MTLPNPEDVDQVLRCAFFTKDLSWKDAGLSFETYLTDALEKVPWIGDGLCVWMFRGF